MLIDLFMQIQGSRSLKRILMTIGLASKYLCLINIFFRLSSDFVTFAISLTLGFDAFLFFVLFVNNFSSVVNSLSTTVQLKSRAFRGESSRHIFRALINTRALDRSITIYTSWSFANSTGQQQSHITVPAVLSSDLIQNSGLKCRHFYKLEI